MTTQTPAPARPAKQRGLGFALKRGTGFALAALIALAPSAAPAQEFNPLGWIGNLFKPAAPEPSPLIKHRPERRQPATAPKPKKAARSEEKRARQTEAAIAAAQVEPNYFVAVIGDSLGQMMGQGLTEAFADRPEVSILRKAKESSGLVRDDFYDWPKAAQELLQSGQRIDIAVIMIGSNDRQTLRDGEGRAFEPLSPQWAEAYARRVEQVATLFRDRKIPLIWAGLPVMKSERLAADASAFNDLYREHAAKAGAKFVDLWEAFATENGAFSAAGPDINGEIVKLRAADGVHFTKAGARKLAHFVEPDIRRTLDEAMARAKPEGPGIAAPAEAKLPEEQSTPGEVETVAPPPPPKPVAGPVLPLTGPARSPGGELASPGPRSQALARQTPRPSEPQPGRADDFSWPRN